MAEKQSQELKPIQTRRRNPERRQIVPNGAGPLLATAGMMLGEQARGYIFVDAGLPTPGRYWMETVPPDLAAQLRGMADSQGWLPPWSRWWDEQELSALLPD